MSSLLSSATSVTSLISSSTVPSGSSSVFGSIVSPLTPAIMMRETSSPATAGTVLLASLLLGQALALPSASPAVVSNKVQRDAISAAAKQHVACDKASIAAILGANHPEVTINSVEAVAEGASFGGGSDNPAFSSPATRLPALCAVDINVKSSDSSSYNFGLFLPDQTWSERFMTTGNGGFGGGINW